MIRKVAVIMGSDSDWPVVKGACAQLKALDIPFEAHILSAHRTPAEAADFAKCPGQRLWCDPVRGGHGGPSGRCLCRQHHPACHRYPDEGRRDGRSGRAAGHGPDAQRHPGATVALNGAKNAAWLAAEILALSDDTLAGKLEAERVSMAQQIAAKEEKLQNELKEL